MILGITPKKPTHPKEEFYSHKLHTASFLLLQLKGQNLPRLRDYP